MQKQNPGDPVAGLEERNVFVGEEERPRDDAAVEAKLWPRPDGAVEELPGRCVDFSIW